MEMVTEAGVRGQSRSQPRGNTERFQRTETQTRDVQRLRGVEQGAQPLPRRQIQSVGVETNAGHHDFPHAVGQQGA